MLRRIIVLVVLAAGLVTVPPADAGWQWADAGQATIHPGVQTVADPGQCTSNFVFIDPIDVYLGTAAHCVGAVGTPVAISGAMAPGQVAYTGGELSDFALVRIAAGDRIRVNPSVPHWGGPTAGHSVAVPNETIYSYGNSSLRLGVEALSPKIGILHERNGNTMAVNTVTPGIPGDSGSAYLDAHGAALGVLSQIEVVVSTSTSVPVRNTITDVGDALNRARAATGRDLRLALGTTPFTPFVP